MKAGKVVYVIYLICVNKSDPDIAGARFVVSDNGDILSPKYAPEIIAPPIKPTGIPSAFPIASRAIPIVAIVLQELPLEIEIIAVIIAVAKRKILGFKIWRP